MLLKQVSYAHQGCYHLLKIYTVKNSHFIHSPKLLETPVQFLINAII